MHIHKLKNLIKEEVKIRNHKRKHNKNSLLGAISKLKPAVLRSSLNREFLELKTVGLKSGVLNPPVFNKKSGIIGIRKIV